ncbi:MAG: adenosylcobinamide-GDP ribazoletransferase [Fibrobacteres bacterium]|nr:adenosylcobinamide-GDP ribazoletransferase [Fibrobacterota bacterium]
MISEYIIKPAVTALRTLTIIPVPGSDTPVFGRSLLCFPLAGVIIGGLCCGLLFLLTSYTNADPLLVSALIVFLSVLITGALHLDGIADVADGFGGGKTKEKILEIMKDPRQGTFGVSAIVFDIIIKTLLIRPLVENDAYTSIGALFLVSRGLQPLLIAFFPYARKDGGTAAPFSEGAKSFAVFSVLVTMAVVTYVLKASGLVMFSVALLIVLIWGLYCKKKIGGITGDCIGAGNEFAEMTILLCSNLVII